MAFSPTLPSADLLTLEFLAADREETTSPDGKDVVAGLTAQPKALPPKYFYDHQGSLLFEQITTLPEYYLTRTEASILQTYGDAIAAIVGPCELMELGSGSSTKTRYLLNAMARAGQPLHYIPVDVSGEMLKATAQALLGEYTHLTIHGLVGTYDAALAHPLPASSHPRLIAFIGSTLGNLDPHQCQTLLEQVRAALKEGDYFLLGVDLAKDPQILEQAYNDRQGVTAAFNLNMLSHLNWRFGGNFVLKDFSHRALFNSAASQIELYIDSQKSQTVTLQTLDLTVEFQAGESLLSEISRKFDLSELQQLLARVGLPVAEVFTDPDHWFGLLLCRRV